MKQLIVITAALYLGFIGVGALLPSSERADFALALLALNAVGALSCCLWCLWMTRTPLPETSNPPPVL